MKSFSALILIVSFCAPTARAANSGSGQLTDAQDKPVPGAKVQVTATSGAKTTKIPPPHLVAAQEKTPVATGDKVLHATGPSGF
jgi:hypothetical protein